MRTETCRHGAITVHVEDGGTARLWACADCHRRFYPACPECVSVGHRGEVHVEAESVAAELIRAAVESIRLAQVEVSEVAWSLGREHPMFDRLMMAVTRLAALAGENR